jgi:hypothetical protein
MDAKQKNLAAWKIINNVSRPKCNNERIDISANELNQFFTMVVDSNISAGMDTDKMRIVNPPRPSINVQTNHSKFKFQNISPDSVILATKGLKASYSEDAFGLSAFLLKHIVDIIAPHLCTLMNTSMIHGEFPDVLKTSIVIPIYKKGNKNVPENYRPITLVTIFSKVFEAIVTNQLRDYFKLHKLLNTCQYGFRTGCSTIDAVERVVREILNNFEENKITSVTLLDLSKAFDSISHPLLIEKLKLYGVSDKVLNFIYTYLLNRKQAVKVNGNLSDYRVVNRGVPQGSIIGPLLFVIYINDLPNVMQVSPVLYADDTTLVMGHKNLETLIYDKDIEIGKMTNWFKENKLTINHDKTENILFSLNKNVTIHNKCNYIKLLGMYIDCGLTWSVHIDHLISKLTRGIYLLRRLRQCLSFKYLCITYHALLQSHIDYGVLLYGSSAGWKLVFKWQKKAVRAILGFPSWRSCRGCFASLKILTVPGTYVYQSVVYIKTHKNDFETGSDVHSYGTRNRDQLIPMKIRLTKTKNSYQYQGIKFFNLLPTKIKNYPIKKFKQELKTLLVKGEGYSLQEIEDYLKNLNLT